jgi:hypothetical protein
LREGLEEGLLRGFFSVAAIAKEPVGDMKHPGAESAHNFGKRTFIFCARLTRQFEF